MKLIDVHFLDSIIKDYDDVLNVNMHFEGL